MKYLKIIIIILISIIMSFNTSYATNSGATTWRELQDVDFYGDMSVANELYTIIIINVQQNESIENMSDADLKAYNKIVSKYIDAIQIIKGNNKKTGVLKSSNSNKMNELNTHTIWANGIINRAKIFGVLNKDITCQYIINEFLKERSEIYDK